jgi:Possible tRNA binding domain
VRVHRIIDQRCIQIGVVGRFDNTAAAADAAEGEVEKPSGVKLTAVQSSILLALGLQRKAIEDVEVSTQCTLDRFDPGSFVDMN